MVSQGLEERARIARRPNDRHANSRIYYAADRPPSLLAVWTSRLAIFAAVVLVVTVVLHRLLSLPTPIAMTIATAVFGAAVASLAMGFIAGLDIWVTGRQGAARVIAGSVVAIGLLAVPAVVWIVSLNWPELYDVTTDVSDPPAYSVAKSARLPGANPVDYKREEFAHLQQASYPDLKTLTVPRSTEGAYELVLQALGKLKLKTALEVPPDIEDGLPGTIELRDKTMILGFVDDVAIRVTGDEQSARIDVRSSSRYGRNDFGRNAERVRMILREIVGRLEASVPDQEKALRELRQKEKAKAKGQTGRDQGSKADRKRRDPSRSGTRRELERRGLRPGAGGNQGRDKPPAQSIE